MCDMFQALQLLSLLNPCAMFAASQELKQILHPREDLNMFYKSAYSLSRVSYSKPVMKSDYYYTVINPWNAK